MIVNMSRSTIECERKDGRRVTLEGEFTFPAPGKYIFNMFGQRPTHWDSPNSNEALTQEEFSTIVDEIRREFARTGGQLELD